MTVQLMGAPSAEPGEPWPGCHGWLLPAPPLTVLGHIVPGELESLGGRHVTQSLQRCLQVVRTWRLLDGASRVLEKWSHQGTVHLVGLF